MLFVFLFVAFLGNSKQLKDLRRELGILPFSYLSSLEYRYEDSVILIIFLS